MPKGSNVLYPGERLYTGEYLQSENGTYKWILQGEDGLVLSRRSSEAMLWCSGSMKDPAYATMQADGNFVVYDFSRCPLWSTGTDGRLHSYLVLHDSGAVVIYQPHAPVWSTSTPPILPSGASDD